MEAALRRSRSCPLSVELRCYRLETTPLFETIIAHRARWQHLRLFVLVANLAAIEGPFPLLRSLTTTVWISTIEDARRRSTAFRASPLLHRVAIAQYEEVFHDMLPWSQLTVLLIQSMQIKQCMTILALAPLLVYCDVTFSRHEEGVDTEDDMPRSHIALAHIKHLKLRGPRQLLNPLSVLSLPALQRLHINEASLNQTPSRRYLTGVRALGRFASGSLHFLALITPQRYPQSCSALLSANPSPLAFCILDRAQRPRISTKVIGRRRRRRR
ncbi:hypothetical protein B0H16DRAFT_459619 [Mycena metata]|uniref:Uncharacterized protein n=1 Tax=Mycena metata TaxID=1033252 RepID=A0AAD7HAE8_9AGAR|nr:hypothetical protein B0H16DRAFT_459619 [Mycena metata]